MFSVGDIVRLKDGRDTASGIDIEHGWPLDNDGETVRFDVLMKVKTIGPDGEIYVVFPQWCNVDAVDVNDNNEGKGWKMGAGDIEALVPGDAVTPFKKTAKHYEGVVFPNDGIYVKTVPVGSTYGSGTFTDTEPVLIIGKNNIGTTPIQGNYYRWDDLVAGTPATLPARTPAPEPFVIPTYSMIVNGEARVVYGEGNYLKLPDYLENKFIIHEAFYREVFGLSSAITGSAQYHPGDSEFDTSCTGFEEFLQDYVAERPEVERTITVDTSIANDTSDMELIAIVMKAKKAADILRDRHHRHGGLYRALGLDTTISSRALNDDFHASDSEFSYLCEGFNNFLNRLASGMLKVKEAQASLPSTASPEVIQMMREYYGI